MVKKATEPAATAIVVEVMKTQVREEQKLNQMSQANRLRLDLDA